MPPLISYLRLKKGSTPPTSHIPPTNPPKPTRTPPTNHHQPSPPPPHRRHTATIITYDHHLPPPLLHYHQLTAIPDLELVQASPGGVVLQAINSLDLSKHFLCGVERVVARSGG